MCILTGDASVHGSSRSPPPGLARCRLSPPVFDGFHLHTPVQVRSEQLTHLSSESSPVLMATSLLCESGQQEEAVSERRKWPPAATHFLLLHSREVSGVSPRVRLQPLLADS